MHQEQVGLLPHQVLRHRQLLLGMRLGLV